jgi:anti-sigma factor RsiW
MNHPTDLLADYVRGALGERERAGVEAHLRRCRRCAGEVALAATSRRALAAMSQEPSPSGLHDAAIDEARRGAATTGGRVASIENGPGGRDAHPRTSRAGRWTQWAAAAGVAAAIALLALTLPRAGNPGTQMAPAAGPALAESGGPSLRDLRPASGVQTTNTNYDSGALVSLAAAYVPAAPTGFAASGSQTAAQAADGASPAALGSTSNGANGFEPALLGTATKCLSRAFENSVVGRPVRVIEARFEGTPAFVGVYVSGPSASQPPDRVNVYVAAKAGCTILWSTQVAA